MVSAATIQRRALAENRLRSILATYVVASARTLEQKISDAGPTNQRIDPHILTDARKSLMQKGVITTIQTGGHPWYHLTTAEANTVQARLSDLDSLHRQTTRPKFSMPRPDIGNCHISSTSSTNGFELFRPLLRP
jgi:hypothetical protein